MFSGVYLVTHLFRYCSQGEPGFDGDLLRSKTEATRT